MKYCPKCKAEYSDDQAICPIDTTTLVDKSPEVVSEPSDPMMGRVIADKYRIERLIGRGGMGAVYEGKHLLLDRAVAIKVLHQNMTADERAATRFIREAKASAKIEHANAVTIHDFGVLKDGSAYLIMEFIRGRSLRQLLMKSSKITLEQAIDWVIQVCNVLEVAHQQGIIHRDLKPENVMLKENADGSMTVKVVDFGLAKLVSGDGESSGANLTQTGEVLGTPHYMAPEFYEGEEVDKRADIYAIGVILYEMLCGDAPFVGTVQSIIGGHLFKEPAPIFNINPSVHPKINEVVQHALKKKRDERFASAAELATALKTALKDVLKDGSSAPKSEAGGEGASAVAASASSAPSMPLPRASHTDQLGHEQHSHNTGMIGSGSSTSQLVDEERRSNEFSKRNTGAITYDTVSMNNKGELGSSQSGSGGSQQLANWQVNTVFTSGPLPQEEYEEVEAPESFFEMLASMKRELAIGAVIVTVLALAVVAFIIRTQSANIRVSPLPETPAATATQGS